MDEMVGVRALKDRLSKYLRRVQGGERVVITDRGRPIAALVALESAPGEEADWELVRRGVAAWPGGKPRGAESAPRLSGSPASDAVLSGRR